MTSRRGTDRGFDLPDWLDPPVERRAAERRGAERRVAPRRPAGPAQPERRADAERRSASRRTATDRPQSAPASVRRAATRRTPRHAARLAPGVLERRLLVFATVLLLAYGLVMAYSASTAQAYFDYGSSFYFLKKQLVFAVIGLVAMLALARVDYVWYRRLALPFAGGCGVLLLAVLVPGIGTVVHGARRWIMLGGQSFTPSEFAKLACVMLVATLIVNRPQNVLEGRGFSGLVAVGIAPAGLLIMLEPDLGTTLVLIVAVVAVLVAAGARVRHLAALAGGGGALVLMLIVAAPYRMARFTAFLHPLQDTHGTNWQATQSLISIASGHFFGVGLGNSVQKFGFLPEHNTDMITGIIGEELGLFGLLLLVGCYMFLAWAAFKIALSCRELFGKLLAAGIISMLVGQAAINIGAALGLLPLTGVPLPLVSVGGTSLVVVLAGIGILLNIATNRRSHIGVSPAGSGGPSGRGRNGRPHHAGAGRGRRGRGQGR